MATGNGILRKMSGSVGDLTYRVVNGQQTEAARVTHVKNPRTEGQMGHRTKWANVLAMFRAGAPSLKDAFERKTGRTSDYNCFTSINLQSSGVFLTKQMAAQGGGIVAPYQITQGSLPAIQVTGEGEEAVSDLRLGSLTIGASTTVAELAAAIIRNNDNWMEGDQLSFFCFKQMYDTTENLPYIVCQRTRVALKLTDATLVLEVMPACAMGVKDGCLAIGTGLPEGAFAWVHSRKGSSGKTMVSSQRLQLNNPLYLQYASVSAQSNAMLSYGVSDAAFLKPDGSTSENVLPVLPPAGPSDGQQTETPNGGQQTGGNSQTGGGSGTNTDGGSGDVEGGDNSNPPAFG